MLSLGNELKYTKTWHMLAYSPITLNVTTYIIHILQMSASGDAQYLVQTSHINRTKSGNLKVCRLVLKLYLPNPLKPGVK